MPIAIRNLRLPDDELAVQRLDTTFGTNKVYELQVTESILSLIEIDASVSKSYNIDLQSDEFDAPTSGSMVADLDGAIIGLCSVQLQQWNRRAILHHLYVDVKHRGVGVGKLLLDSAAAWAAESSARCLWVETQNINYPAIQFYRRHGFRLCGCDITLYDPDAVLPGEAALYFCLTL